MIDLGRLHLPQKLPGIRAKRLDVAALAFDVNRIDGEAGLSASAGPATDGDLIAGKFDVDVLEVVLLRAEDPDVAMLRRSAWLPCCLAALLPYFLPRCLVASLPFLNFEL